ncbi:hypothetical protein [Bradyrhizobium paxllaeri]|uniref:hypothetical protein n=1 Tax=Bradyrhizobium paxllaeri TaxID=190148 RepID=UPI0008107C2A|nr:hypothetical protein [Bradyrhizobium paxllaeri]
MPDGESYPNCFGPYLRYAISTNFEYFAFFDERANFRLFLLAEFKKAGQQDEFVDRLNAALSDLYPGSSSPSVDLGPADDNIPFATVRAPTTAVTPVAPGGPLFVLWEQYISRVELSLPLKLSVLPPFTKRKIVQRWNEGKKSSAELLIGMMDDGCPFAAAQFLRGAAGSVSTRVRGIWDQNRGKQPVQVNSRFFGQALTDFAYGLEYRRDPPSTSQIGLDEWMSLHLTPAGSIDEDGCYAHGRFARLASQQSHGAHVMDVLVGLTPISSRIGPSSGGGDRRDPPSWNPGNATTDPACDADLVFVQFSDDCIRDATGVWLKGYVFEGIRYIMSFADPSVTKRVIINLSYGPTTGPHDGTADLEAILSALVTEFDGSAGKPKLDIFLPAGNTYLTEEHAFFTRSSGQPGQVEWTWRLPPDNTVLCFSEVWMDTAAATGAAVTLTSPRGNNIPVASNVVMGSSTMWRLEVGPTVAAPGIAAQEHGDYTIKVAGIPVNAEVHAYAARTNPNMGVTTGAKRSLFVDQNWERTRSATAAYTRVNGEFDKTGSLVSRFGTLNGIATANDAHVHVAGGYILFDGRKSLYSSAGPARGSSATRRVGPDYVLPCDESYALTGMLAGGTRSGSMFRLIGTSTAAPQLARQFIKTTYPQPYNFSTSPPEPEKRGAGDLPPP